MATVLVVDDRATNRELARSALDLAGYHVVEASGGRQALDLARRVHPDVVLADVVMPGMDGYEFVQTLRADAATADIPVLLYSANYRPDEAEPLASAYGVAKLVPKSAEPAQLLAAVDEALHGRPAVDPAVADPAVAVEHLRTVTAKLVEKVLALDESEARFAALGELSPVGIAIGGEDLHATYINPSLAGIAGAPAQELLGTGWLRCVPAEQRDSALPRDTVTYYGRVTLAEHRDRWLHTVVRFLRDDDHRRSGFIATVDDVTPVIEAERYRHTAEQARETAQRDRIEQRFDALSRLAGAIAHDFNNLLNVILSFGEFAEEAVGRAVGTALTAETADQVLGDLDRIGEAGRRAAHLAHQLLTFGGREIVRPTVINVNDLINDTSAMIRAAVGQQVTLELDLDPTLRNTRADTAQLRQVLLNLATNARDAMPSGGRLTITTTIADADRLHICVADTGVGMTADVAEQAIEPFFSTKPRGRAAGLGLATAYGIVNQAGGTLTIDSAPGRGTTIHIRLPVTGEPADAQRPPAPAGPHAAGRTILVAEDEDGVREVVTRILTGAGYRVLAATDGEAALDLARDHPGPIDALLTDVVMPRMDGPRLVEALAGVRPGTPVLFMSGYAAPLMTAEGVLPPGVTVVGKPFTRNDLLTAVRAVIGHPAGRVPGGRDFRP